MPTPSDRPSTLLPRKPSALIRIALADLAKIEKSPRYFIDMSSWHEPDMDAKICAVCFAGSVMAMTLESDPEDELHPDLFPMDDPDEFGVTTAQKLNALNSLRAGAVADAMCCYLKYDESEIARAPELAVAEYFLNPEKFKRDLEELAALCEAEGF